MNRAIVNGTIQELTLLTYLQHSIWILGFEIKNSIKRANEYPSNKCFYLSIHSNAGGERGGEIFTSPADTESDKNVTVFW